MSEKKHEEHKSTEPTDKTEPEPKRPTSGWQGALYNIGEALEIAGNNQSNQDDKLHTLRLAKVFKDEATK
jgi:hypothetical protein